MYGVRRKSIHTREQAGHERDRAGRAHVATVQACSQSDVREEETGQYETEKEDKQQYEKRKRRERTKEGRG
jgi:hypothetical protein